MAPGGRLITIDCPHCHRFFRERAAAVHQGVAIQCPTCSRAIVFTADSPFDCVRKALHEARTARLGGK